MKTISLDHFLQQIDAIAAAQPAYRLGADGSNGECDCIGLIIGAIRRAGGTWGGTHGSNYAARNATLQLAPLTSAGQLSPGCLVYKTAPPGASNHHLPSRYEDHPDQLDYYHVGVVRSVSPLRIIHCTTPGICTDETIFPWSHFGWPAAVSAKTAPAPASLTAVVTAPSGSCVNLRKTPGGALLERLPLGATVTVEEQGDTWCRISYAGRTGWMMTAFLCFPADDLTARITALEERLSRLEQNLSGGDAP